MDDVTKYRKAWMLILLTVAIGAAKTGAPKTPKPVAPPAEALPKEHPPKEIKQGKPEIDPLDDWADWMSLRGRIDHPGLVVKQADLVRAKQNIAQYPWAQLYLKNLQASVDPIVDKIDAAYAARMIDATTPGDVNFTPCPACRDQGKPYNEHGVWDWNANDPDKITCHVCGTVYPSNKYPETVQINSQWGHSQTISFFGGEPFNAFGYQCRPSFTANIRARKVAFMADTARKLGEAYALTGQPKYAHAARSILLRFAEVYPYWLVHVGYGEYADMDPRIVASHMKELPADELVYPPNKPDKQLHSEFWTAGRATGVGSEGRWLKQVTESYDFTCTAVDAGSTIYSDADRLKIEKNLLLEGTVLLVGDKNIDNKSVGNRSAVALVGMCVGEPTLVRFGLDGFDQTLAQYFLPDGTTPESPAYALMALSGIEESGLAFRGYSDPTGYEDVHQKRLDNVDLYHNTAYSKVWEAMFNTLQGDLHYPPFADAYQHSVIGAHNAEIMADNYPDRPKYLSLLKEEMGNDLTKTGSSAALYYRQPGIESKDSPKITLPDICPPDLGIGFMRTGDDGRESLLLLNASHWGAHHHLDSLNLYYWKRGHEMLSDLGYLTDSPNKPMTSRTFAHNTVLIDEADQTSEQRGGDVDLFKITPHVKVMRASSAAYAQAKRYVRTSAVVLHDDFSYVVDEFSVEGGSKQDYVFHGPNSDPAQVTGISMQPINQPIYDLKNVKQSPADGTWAITWKIADSSKFTAWSIGQPNETAYIGDGWGQRNYDNSDRGATLPYIVRRCTGDGQKDFASVFEEFAPNQSHITKTSRLPATGVCAIEIDTSAGRDYAIISPAVQAWQVKTPDGELSGSSRFTMVAIQAGKNWAFNDESTGVNLNGQAIGGE